MADTEQNVAIDLGKYQLGWSDEEDYVYKPQKGLNEDIIREMSFLKKRARVDARFPAPFLRNL